MTGMTLADLRNLPPTVDLMTAARALGIGRTKAYELARCGKFPCRIIRIGDLYRVATLDLIRLLGGIENDHEMPSKAS
jgi:predicted DNA-binding transcriptional regulator AlpA